VKIVIDGLLKK